MAKKDIPRDPNTLMQAYEALPPLERAIVDTLAIIGEKAPITTLGTCLGKSSFRIEGRKIVGKSLAPYLKRLISQGLVQAVSIYYLCPPSILEEVNRRAAKDEHYASLAQAVLSVISPKHGSYTAPAILREIRTALLMGDFSRLEPALLMGMKLLPVPYAWYHPLTHILRLPQDRDLIRGLPGFLPLEAAYGLTKQRVDSLKPSDQEAHLLEELLLEMKGSKGFSPHFYRPLLVRWIWRGEWDRARRVMEELDSPALAAYDGWLAFAQGKGNEAMVHFERAQKALRRPRERGSPLIPGVPGIFHILALLQSADPRGLEEAGRLIDAGKMTNTSARWFWVYRILGRVLCLQMNNLDEAKEDGMARLPELEEPFTILVHALAQCWIFPQNQENYPALEKAFAKASEGGYLYLAQEMADLLAKLGSPTQPPAQEGLAPGRRSLAGLLGQKTDWERALDSLRRLGPQEQPSIDGQSSRLVWILNTRTSYGYPAVSPREQKATARGGWTKGRVVSLKRLYEDHGKLNFLTAQDRKVCSFITYKIEYGGWGRSYPTAVYNLPTNQALQALVGHPLVFSEHDRDMRIELVPGEVQLRILRKDKSIILSLSPSLEEGQEVYLVEESPIRLRVIAVTEEHQRMAKIIGKAMKVPDWAQERIMESVVGLASLVTVQSDIGWEEGIEEVAADPQPYLRLLPSGPGLTVDLAVKPLAEDGPLCKPGEGGEGLIATVNGRKVQANRDLKEERRRAAGIVASCPTLDRLDQGGGIWDIDDPQDCLELLLELQGLNGEVTVEWPRGGMRQVTRPVDLRQLSLSIHRQRDWFALSGQIQLDEGLVMDLQKLLALLDDNPGRFIPLDQGRYLALTKAFRRRLEELRAYREPRGKDLLLHPLMAPGLAELLGEAGQVEADDAWRDQARRMEEARAYQPILPSTLRAELRDYQLEGFQWLARLAQWGVGACLADDMGLGKTVEALALILDRAPHGPTLVVAPTSVCLNWAEETRRFAPTLNIRLLAGPQDRERLLASLGPMDMLISSYGLLHHEEGLAKVNWQTIVLDEAQAIKNITTKRAQAAMKLKADFRLATTGTPLENHLGELWSLFRFLNPGLLGSLERFNRHYAQPIERVNDREAWKRLRKLVRPFILRRTKEQVLEELPSRTEILLRVEMSAEERALYEALRQQALERLSGEGQGPGHLEILAEIMRLRRACCHPRLILKDSTLPGSKLLELEDLLEELRAGGHKALIFSQFVDHLSLMRELLERRGIIYQYLDGSTPAKERQRRVTAFQSGEGEVFLISLRAGGLGLNLTAADYVIHMDPWWNPAVEDQASDRAHRIGQQRPVTIYRMVAKDTIEEKIVDLHQQKRDLADGLLEGSDMAGKMSAEELLRLIGER